MAVATFVIGDYRYTQISENVRNVRAQVVNVIQDSYGDIPDLVTYDDITYSVINLDSCFYNCINLVYAPRIPDVYSMEQTFLGCTSLVTPPAVINGASMNRCFFGCTSLEFAPVLVNCNNLTECFRGCTSLHGDIYIYSDELQTLYGNDCFRNTTQPIIIHAMNDNTETCDTLAATANNGNVYVNVYPDSPIDFNSAYMYYMDDDDLKQLSLQTNANLVQCEVPDLVHGNIITTNVNDALLDLQSRQPLYAPCFVGTQKMYGVTTTNNGDGTFTVDGTATSDISIPLIETKVLINDESKYRLSLYGVVGDQKMMERTNIIISTYNNEYSYTPISLPAIWGNSPITVPPGMMQYNTWRISVSLMIKRNDTLYGLIRPIITKEVG